MLRFNYQSTLDLIKASLWRYSIPGNVGWETFEEMKKHELLMLPISIFSSLQLNEALKNEWRKAIYQQVVFNVNYHRIQVSLPINVPYVFLKGTEAAKYYNNPKSRTLGDIDIITRHKDFDVAYQQLLDEKFQILETTDREISLLKDGVIVELHRSFAKLNELEYAEYLDNAILSNIRNTHSLPDLINGLVFLEHISQHLVSGLGLRQIIDWMMFVDKCLPDEQWNDFSILSQNIGLEKLAKVTTRMCEMYLGLPERQWCSDIDEMLCDELMEYVLLCGNFGNKRVGGRQITENVLVYARGPKQTLKLLQERGLYNWKMAQKYSFLKPFAWLYQAGRYLKKGFLQDDVRKDLDTAYYESRRKIELFDALGVRQDSKGLVVYKNGKYIKQ